MLYTQDIYPRMKPFVCVLRYCTLRITSRVARFFLVGTYNIPKREKYTRWPHNTQNGLTKFTPNRRKINQMDFKNTKIFHYKTIQNFPKSGFWFENIDTVWQPGSQAVAFGKAIICVCSRAKPPLLDIHKFESSFDCPHCLRLGLVKINSNLVQFKSHDRKTNSTFNICISFDLESML
jgi:hypothetical protein